MVQDAYAAGRIDEGLGAYSTEYLAMDMHAQNCMLAPMQREPILDLGAAVVDRFSFALGGGDRTA